MAGKQSTFWRDNLPKLKELVEQGKTDQEIADAMSITTSRVMNARTRYGIPSGENYRTTHIANPTTSEPPERPDPTNAEIARLEAETRRLSDELTHHKAKLRTAQRENALFEGLAETIKETVAPLPPAKYTPRKARGGTKVDMVLLLSDEHADQQISRAATWGLEQYDFNIFRCRLHRLVDTVQSYVGTHLPAHDFERGWIFKLGDAVQGDIHGSGPKNYFGSTLKAAIAVGDAEAQAIQAMLPLFPQGIHIVCVSGNHPRRSVRKDYGGPHDNFDYLVATQIATRLSAEIDAGRVTLHAPAAWTAYVEVRGRLWALNHGDDVRGYAGIPWYGFSRKNQRVQSLVARAGQRVRYFCYGHYHTAIEMQETDADSLHAGNWTFTDDYAQNALGVGSEPVQQLYAVDDDRGIILKVPIYVRDAEREDAYREGEWEPAFGRGSVLDRVSPEATGFPVVKAA